MDSFLNWLGGKSKLANWIINQMPPHKLYVEVFGGAGWVLFRKPRSEKEIFNDIDSDLINLFMVCRDQPDALAKAMEFLPQSRELHRLFYSESRKTKARLGDIERAARFYYVMRYSFQSHLQSYSPVPGGSSCLIESGLAGMKTCSYRLRQVSIENLDWRRLIKNADGPDTLFYLDPPYLSTLDAGKATYMRQMAQSDHSALAETLKHIKGKFMLSYDDTPATRRAYGNWAHISKTPDLTYSSHVNRTCPDSILTTELLISNFSRSSKKGGKKT